MAMHITVLAVGKTREQWVREGVQLYAARLKHYADFSYLEIKDEKQITEKTKGMLVLCSPVGKSFSSEEFASWLKKQNRPITFAVGGPEGFPQNIQQKADLSLSFSPMTFPHELFRIMLLEQLYRAMTILKGEPYHK